MVFFVATFNGLVVFMKRIYRVFHGFGQAKFPDSGLVLGSSQFSKLPPKSMLNLKVVKIDQKIIISHHLPKSVTHSVVY